MDVPKEQKWKTRMKRLIFKGGTPSSGRVPRTDGQSEGSAPTPVAFSSTENFYIHQLQNDLENFERFAQQSQSRAILEIWARVASKGRHSLTSLVAELNEYLTCQRASNNDAPLQDPYDVQVLLSLATLLSNTARNDMDIQMAIAVFDYVRLVFGRTVINHRQSLHYVEALGEVGRYDEQEARIAELSLGVTDPNQVRLLTVNKLRDQGSLDQWLVALNDLYSELDMSQVELTDEQSLPLMDRLARRTELRVHGPLISVIMPTYSPGPGIHTAVRSLLEQTWQNIEILVVDDGSPDRYNDLFDKLASIDERVRIIRTGKNGGAYAARNAGLAAATGLFVATHDDDDWSHPDKLAMQAHALVEDESLVASTTAHIRTTEDMRFARVNSRPVHSHKNYSSIMFRRDVVNHIGPWDTVNRGGDSEFEARLAIFGGGKQSILNINKPASFSRVWPGSLTSGEMKRGYHAYSRQLYHQAYSQWHKRSIVDKKSVVLSTGSPRPYPVPTTFEAGKRNNDLGLFDIIFVSDFYNGAKFVNNVLRNIEASSEAGFRVGFMLLNSPQTSKRTRIASRILELQAAGVVTQVSHDDIAETRLLIVYDTSIGMFLDELESKVRVQRGLTIYDELPTLVSQKPRNPVLLHQALPYLDRSFGTRFRIASTSPAGAELLATSVPPARLLGRDFVWNTPLPESPRDGIMAPSDTPAVGYHSFSNRLRWPSTQAAFNAAYLSEHFHTKLYGHLAPARKKYGEQCLAEVEVIDSDESTLEQFFADIDFWIYFPDDRIMEATAWQPVIEALQAGKVVILPKYLERLYGEAAIYATEDEVEALVREYSEDHEKYIRQANLGRTYYLEHHSLAHYKQWIERLTSLSSVDR